MEHQSLQSLMIVVGIAFLVPILLHKLNLRALPVVVAEIVAGLIIGKSGLNLVKEDPILTLLSLLGFIFLMFLSGVEIDFTIFGGKKGGRGAHGKRFFHPLFVSFAIFLLILGLSYVLSLALVEMELAGDPYLMTIMIATISLGVVVPVLKERRLLEQELGQTLLLISVISDFVTMILLAVYISWKSGSMASMALLLLFFVLVVATYLIIRRFAGQAVFRILGSGTVQLGTRAVFALILFFVVLSESLGAENILGAFLAGVIVALVAPQKSFLHQLDSFGYGFLIPIFFVMVGVKLDIWGLFADWRVLVLIPVLLLFILLSKLVPTLVLRFWFSWSETLGSGVLLASTLSLVIAAATIAHELGLIDDAMHGALIVVAVLSCLIFPVLFSRLFPSQPVERKIRVAIVGANHVTLPVVNELGRHPGYEVQLFSTEAQAAQGADGSGETASSGEGKWSAVSVASLNREALEAGGTFGADTVVLGTMDDEQNVLLARYAKAKGVRRIIVRVEDPKLQEQVRREGFTVFSTLFASTALLKAAIENPSVVDFISEQTGSLVEVTVDNPRWHGALLRNLPRLDGLLILRIYRGESFIIPHGNTEILTGDRLLVSGDEESVYRLRENLG